MLNRMRSKLGAFVAVLCGFVVTSVQAALPTEATAAFTELSGSITDILGAVWPIVAAVVVGFVLIKLFRKGANKVG